MEAASNMNTIFRHFIDRPSDDLKTKNIRKGLASWFLNSFPHSEFLNEDRVMYDVVEQASSLGITSGEKYLEVYIRTELKPFLYKHKVKVQGTEGLIFEDPLSLDQAYAITSDVLRAEYYGILQDSEEIDDFPIEIVEFMQVQKDNRVLDLLMNAHEISTGVSRGNIGSGDAAEILQQESQAILEIYDKDKLVELGEIFPQLLESEDGKGTTKFKFGMYTGIPTIDNDTRGVYTSRVYGIEGAPGRGKTRFAIGVFGYRAAVQHNLNVSFRTLEQSVEEIEAIFVSLHVYFLFGKIVPDNFILSEDSIKDEDIKNKVKAARQDLFKSGKYGKIKVKQDKLYLGTFIQAFKQQDRLEGGMDMYIIDYMALIEQEAPKQGERYYRHLDEWKIIQQAYRKFKAYCLHNGKIGVALNQLNRSGIEKSNAGKATDENDAQGGVEVYRSTDYNIVVGGTEEMMAQSKRQLYNPKKRSSKGIGVLMIDCIIECAYFFEKKGNNI